MPATLTKLPLLPKREGPAVTRSQTERLWLIGGGLVACILILIGYFFFISPRRSQTADVRSQVDSAQQQNAVLRARLDALREQAKDLPRYQADLARARLALPSTSGVSDFVRSLQSLGSATQTNVTSLSLGQPAAVRALAAPAASTPSSAPTSGAASASTPATGVASAYSMSINATVSGSPAALDKFLDQLQAVQPRAVLVTQVAESSASTGSGSSGGSGTTLQLTMQAFVAPATPAPAATPTTSPTP